MVMLLLSFLDEDRRVSYETACFLETLYVKDQMNFKGILFLKLSEKRGTTILKRWIRLPLCKMDKAHFGILQCVAECVQKLFGQSLTLSAGPKKGRGTALTCLASLPASRPGASSRDHR